MNRFFQKLILSFCVITTINLISMERNINPEAYIKRISEKYTIPTDQAERIKSNILCGYLPLINKCIKTNNENCHTLFFISRISTDYVGQAENLALRQELDPNESLQQ